MNKQIIYLKETSSYDDILKNNHSKMPLIFKKLIFLYKNIFNIITKKKTQDKEIWVLPVKEEYCESKLKELFKKVSLENIYLISNELKEKQAYKIMDEQKQEYITEEKIKKILLVHILEHITNLQKKELSDLDLTILVNNKTNLNMYLMEELARQIKTLKIVSLNIYKFKKLEEELYEEEGIAIQFSNSYKKSLEKSKIIINLDFTELEINEYEIFDKAIIVNCISDNIKIKSRLFNGIVVNSCDIEFNKQIINEFKELKIYENYTRLMIYASLIQNQENILRIYEKLIADNIEIIDLMGNSGIINKKEFKNIDKMLDKNKKTE